MQNLLNESTTQDTTNDKSFPKNFNFLVLITKELQEKVNCRQSNDLKRKKERKFLERETRKSIYEKSN